MPKYESNELARHQIDRLLKIQHKAVCENVGTDATKQNIKAINKIVNWSDRLIRKIDRNFYPSAEALK